MYTVGKLLAVSCVLKSIWWFVGIFLSSRDRSKTLRFYFWGGGRVWDQPFHTSISCVLKKYLVVCRHLRFKPRSVEGPTFIFGVEV